MNADGQCIARRRAAATVLGGALVATGALLPWLTLFAGLQHYSGLIGLYGWLVLAGGAASVAIGLAMLVRRARWLQLSGLTIGLTLTIFTVFLVGRLFETMHGLGADAMMVARPGAVRGDGRSPHRGHRRRTTNTPRVITHGCRRERLRLRRGGKVVRLRRRCIDDRRDFEHAIGRESPAPGVFPDQLRVPCDVLADDLVLGHEALHPLNARPQLLQDIAGPPRDRLEVRSRQRRCVRNLAFDDVPRHRNSPRK